MKRFIRFRQRLDAAFLAVSLAPLLSVLGTFAQIFRFHAESRADQQERAAL